MDTFRGASIKQKLTWIIMFTSSVALVVASLFFFANVVMAIRQAKVVDLSSLGDIIGANCSSALLFKDDKAAAQTLATLQAQPGSTWQSSSLTACSCRGRSSKACGSAATTAMPRSCRDGAARRPSSVPSWPAIRKPA